MSYYLALLQLGMYLEESKYISTITTKKNMYKIVFKNNM